jgi:hypothetical protein
MDRVMRSALLCLLVSVCDIIVATLISPGLFRLALVFGSGVCFFPIILELSERRTR